MAGSEAAAALTEQHRRLQLRVRTLTLRQLLTLWPAWDPTDMTTFPQFAEATGLLVEARRRDSAGVAARYYRAFRVAEGVSGDIAPTLAEAVDPERLMVSLRATGPATLNRALSGGMTPQAAKAQAFVTLSGSVVRHVLDGGRETIKGTADADRQARGWQRVTSGKPCHFCAMLASRGAVYRSRETARAANPAIGKTHDHCACTFEPVYGTASLPESSQRWRSLWNQATPGLSGSDAVNAFRRALAAA